MRKQYSFRPGEQGLDAWDVDRLMVLARDLPVEVLPLERIEQIDENYWYDNGYVPTVRSIAERVSLVLAADLSYPVIIDPEGRVLDGMHRIVKAMIEGRSSVGALRLREMPAPDYTDVRPDELPYDR